MKLNIEELTVKDYEFEGLVDLGNMYAPVKGDFIVEWDGTYPVVQVTCVNIAGLSSYSIIDFKHLAKQIELADAGELYEDYMNRMSERIIEEEDI